VAFHVARTRWCGSAFTPAACGEFGRRSDVSSEGLTVFITVFFVDSIAFSSSSRHVFV
jgi:hypothetical protein